MNTVVYTHPEFERQFKRFQKKYHSLVDDFRIFLQNIKEDPYQGVSLGNSLRKVRLRVSSKGSGKSGGMRVITFQLNKRDENNIEITLLYIYDKSEISNVSEKFIQQLLRQK